MKTTLTLALAIMGIASFAQAPTTDIKIDFGAKAITQIPEKNELKNKKYVRIVIDNLPNGAYKVGINKTDSTVSVGAMPALFGALTFGAGFNSLLAGLAGYSVRNVGALVAKQESTSEKAKKAAGTKKATESISQTDGSNTEYLSQFSCSGEKNEAILAAIHSMRKTVFEFHFNFRDEVIKAADRELFCVEIKSQTNAANFKSNAEGIIKKRLDLEKSLETSYFHYYQTILKDYDKVTECVPLAAGDSMLSAYKKNLGEFLNTFDAKFNEELIAKVYNQLSKPAAPATATYTSLPFYIKADVTKFDINISGIDPAKTPQTFNTTIELEKHPDRLWAFTTGVYVSRLRSPEFSIFTEVTPNSSNPNLLDTLGYRIKQEEGSKLEAGINALFHYGGYIKGTNTGIFVSFGPGLSLESTPRPRIMLGTGLMIGRNNKLAISLGWIGGAVKKLSSSYNTNDIYKPAPTDIVRDGFASSMYLSVGYAIFGK